jgi:hypothetical protein
MDTLIPYLISLIARYPDKAIPVLVIGWLLWRAFNRAKATPLVPDEFPIPVKAQQIVAPTKINRTTQTLDARRATELRNAPPPSGESAVKMSNLRSDLDRSQQADDRAEVARNIEAARPKPPRIIGFQQLDENIRRRRPQSGGLLSALILAQILEKPRSLNPVKPVRVATPTQSNEDAHSAF